MASGYGKQARVPGPMAVNRKRKIMRSMLLPKLRWGSGSVTFICTVQLRKELAMKRLVATLVVLGLGTLLSAGPSRAQLLSYSVDAGAGFATNLTDTSGSGDTILTTIPNVGVLDTSFGPVDFDVVQYVLDTIRTSSQTPESIVVSHSYTVRFILGDYNVLGLDPANGFLGASETLDFTQTVDYTISNIRQNSATNSPVVVNFVGPTSGMLGTVPVSISFVSLDVPGAPQASPLLPPGTFESIGAKTDRVTSVPEPGAMALLFASAIPVTMIRRRARKA
jgi:hypothetical protein